MRDILLWLTGICEVLILSNLIQLEKAASVNKFYSVDVKLTAPLPSWGCSFLIAVLLAAMWCRFSYTKEPKRTLRALLFLMGALALLSYSAFQFLDRDTYLLGNYKNAMIPLGLSQLMIIAGDYTLFGPETGISKDIKKRVNDLYQRGLISEIVGRWGMKLAFGFFAICLGFAGKPEVFVALGFTCMALLIYIIIFDFASAVKLAETP